MSYRKLAAALAFLALTACSKHTTVGASAPLLTAHGPYAGQTYTWYRTHPSQALQEWKWCKTQPANIADANKCWVALNAATAMRP